MRLHVKKINRMIAKLLITVIVFTSQMGYFMEVVHAKSEIEENTGKVEFINENGKVVSDGSLSIIEKIDNDKLNEKGLSVEKETLITKNGIELTTSCGIEEEKIDLIHKKVTSQGISVEAELLMTGEGILITEEAILLEEESVRKLFEQLEISEEYFTILMHNKEGFGIDNKKIKTLISEVGNDKNKLEIMREYVGKDLKLYGENIFEQLIKSEISFEKFEKYLLLVNLFDLSLSEVLKYRELKVESDMELSKLEKIYPNIELGIFKQIEKEKGFSYQEIYLNLNYSWTYELPQN